MKQSTIPTSTSRLRMRLPRAPIPTAPNTVKKEHSFQRAGAKQDCRSRPGKSDVRQCLASKRLTAQDDEVTHQPGDNRDESADQESILDKIMPKEINHVASLLQAGVH